MIPQCGWFIICSRSNRIRWDIHTKWTDSNSHKIFEFLSWLSASSWIKSQALTLNYPATLCHLIASIKSSKISRPSLLYNILNNDPFHRFRRNYKYNFVFLMWPFYIDSVGYSRLLFGCGYNYISTLSFLWIRTELVIQKSF